MTSTAEVHLSCTMNHDFNRSLIENIHHVRVEHKWKFESNNFVALFLKHPMSTFEDFEHLIWLELSFSNSFHWYYIHAYGMCEQNNERFI